MSTVAEISILMANFNNGNFFEDAYRSLLGQTSDQWEAIVIDDASSDNSVETIKNLIDGDPRFRFYCNNVNLGYQKTVALAIGLSRAPVFGRLDPDDALHPEAIEVSLQAHRRHPDAGLIYSDSVYCDSHLNPSHINRGRQVEAGVEPIYNLDGAIRHFATFKRRVYDRTSGIDPFNRRAEDQDLYLKMAEASPVKHVGRPLYFYRVHDRSASTGENLEKAFFWQWVAIVKMAERRNINLEDLFTAHFAERRRIAKFAQRRENLIKIVKERWILATLAKLTGRKL